HRRVSRCFRSGESAISGRCLRPEQLVLFWGLRCSSSNRNLAQARALTEKGPAQALGIKDTTNTFEQEPKARWEKIIGIQDFDSATPGSVSPKQFTRVMLTPQRPSEGQSKANADWFSCITTAA